MGQFKLHANFSESPGQQQAVELLFQGISNNVKHQTLLGVTGSGKTFTMANIIAQVQKPTLVLAHNKTLAAQLYSEFKEFFPENAVHYFVSYYDYYQPEAYVPQRDLYIEKESDINKTIEKYRNAATQALMTRKDTLIVASVSCIYGLGEPEDYKALSRIVTAGEHYQRDKLLRHLSDMQYERSQYDFSPGLYRVRGDTVEIYLASADQVVRIALFGDEIEDLKIINPLTAEVLEKPKSLIIFPAKHFVTPYESLKSIFPVIKDDLKKQVAFFKKQNKLLEAHRLEQRVNFDLEMLAETGYCSGIENYSRYIDRRAQGTPPSTLLDYFPEDWLLFIDESHITIPQVRGMYNGDRARKQTLVDYGFRLQAALDNRPLKFTEFQARLQKVIYVSATPNEYEKNLSKASVQKHPELLNPNYNGVVELLIRPTSLLDPQIDVRPITADQADRLRNDLIKNNYRFMTFAKTQNFSGDNQIDDLLKEIKANVAKGQRVLITTLTKRMAEDLAAFLVEIGIKVHYLHSDFDAIKRVELLQHLRQGFYDVLVGINLLREGLDLPEVSLIGILDADKEGFLRSSTSLVQIIGRAARHNQGRVIMYADHITGSMKTAIDETYRRRKIQEAYNIKYGLTPQTIVKEIRELLIRSVEEETEKKTTVVTDFFKRAESFAALDSKNKKVLLHEMATQMEIYADMLEFEKAAELRDLLKDLQKK
ncbi:MAG TPA: excinuclease ABC subunit UvrB [Candidatus Dojkabacteria bacterium]|nr:excinuclease ABC subunit UvrB [Candidatus Dojkabacteria bacterium]